MYPRGLNKSGSNASNGNPDAPSYYMNQDPQPHPVQPNGQVPQHATLRAPQRKEQAVPLPHQNQYPMGGSQVDDQSYASYAPQSVSRDTSRSPPRQNGFYAAPSYSSNHMQQEYHQDYQNQQQQQQNQFVSMQGYGNSEHASPPHTRLTASYPTSYNPSVSPHSSPPMSQQNAPTMGQDMRDFNHLDPRPQQHHAQQQQQSSFYNVSQEQHYQLPPHPQQAQQPQAQHQQAQYQQAQQPQQHSQPFQQQQFPGVQAVMLQGMQQLSAGGQVPGGFNAALGAQLFQTIAPGAAGYTTQLFGQSQDTVRSFMRMPKAYFAVNHRYVLKKLYLILMPFTNRIWARHRGVDPGQFEGAGNDGVMYLPPREDVNAPDLYIPVMSFLTYVLMVGFVFGMRNNFQAEVLAKYFSKGLGLISLEVLLIKLGLYLINAKPTPWLDVIAYRGYKFVGVVLTMIMGFLVPQMYYPAWIYSATAMAIFLMRSHRKIILPRDADPQQGQDMARRNGFLLFVSLLQYPIYLLLVLDVRH